MLRRHSTEIGWGVLSGLCLVIVATTAHWTTIPFHIVWLGLAVVYGVHRWKLGTALVVLAGVVVFSGVAVFMTTQLPGGPGFDEMAEVPMMAAMFGAMIYYTERAKSALAARQRVLDGERNFARDASHELKTPITVARGHAELIRASVPAGQIREDADVVLDELSRLTRIADRLLLLMSAEHLDFLSRTGVPVDDLMNQVQRRWMPSADRHWRFDSRAPGLVIADQDRLELAIDSLIENAIAFTGPDDTVTVTAQPVGSLLMLSVTDSGAGIPEDQLSRIFDRFTRVDGGRGRGFGGTGLGLAIVLSIAHAHGGEVSVTSRVGLGSTFSLWLPGYRAFDLAAPRSRRAILNPTA